MNPEYLMQAARKGLEKEPEVTWVGPSPITRGLCLGFDNGMIVFADEASGQVTRAPALCPGEDAINGVAGVGASSLAVSTRSNVTFVHFDSSKNNPRAVFSGGSHGVVSTRSGYFIAPLGQSGLLIVKPTSDPIQPMEVTEGTEGRLYFYRMTTLHDGNSKETLVFANRRHGVGLSVFEAGGGRRNVHTMGFDGIDVVDVCGVSPGSLAAVAITRTAEVLWIKDTSSHDDPVAMKLIGVDGPVYRVLATPRHLLVLSSKALYVWQGLVDHVFFSGRPVPNSSPLVTHLDAVDMSLVDGNELYLVMATNQVRSLSLADLDQLPSAVSPPTTETISAVPSRKSGFEGLSPEWHSINVEQRPMTAFA